MELEFEVWLPIAKKIGEIIYLIAKSINELTSGEYVPAEMPALYDKETGKQFDIEQNVKEAGIRNNTELVMI